MNHPNKKKPSAAQKALESLDKVLQGAKQLLIIVHNNPDPDAISSAAALSYLVENRNNLPATIAYGGNIGRAENRAMIHKLNIQLKQITRMRLDKYDRIALVDSQPEAGNNSLPPDAKCHIVIDHHPHQRGGRKADFEVVKSDIGVSATIIVEWLKESEMEIPADLATALSYGIISETQYLGREAGRRDIQAYLYVYTRASVRKLAQIMHPKLPRSYFITLGRAINRTFTFRNLINAHLGDVPSAEIVSEMADFLLRHERIGWSFCTGRFKGKLFLSVRSTNTRANAGKLVKKMVPDPNTVGGHDMLAGGYIQLDTKKNKELKHYEDKLSRDFASLMGYEEADWKPLVMSSETT